MTTLQASLLPAILFATACAAGAPDGAATTPATTPTSAPAPACSQPDVGDEVATEVTAPGTIEGCLEPDGGDDLYAITVAGEGTVHLRIVAERVPGAPAVFVKTRIEPEPPWSNPRTLSALDKPDGVHVLARPGERILLSAHAVPDPHTAGPFRIRIEEARPDDPGEPNDVPGAATPLALGAAFESATTVTIDDTGDAVHERDHYRVEVTRAGTLRAAVESLDGTRVPRVELYAGDRRLARSKLDETSATARVEPGTYVIAIERHHDGSDHRFYPDGGTDLTRRYRVTATVE